MSEHLDVVDGPSATPLGSIGVVSSLETVTAAVAAATQHEQQIYVERVGRGWRWSPVHAGGPYPLLRITARVLGVDHHGLVVPFRTLDDGGTTGGPDDDPVASAMFDRVAGAFGLTPDEARDRQRLGDPTPPTRSPSAFAIMTRRVRSAASPWWADDLIPEIGNVIDHSDPRDLDVLARHPHPAVRRAVAHDAHHRHPVRLPEDLAEDAEAIGRARRLDCTVLARKCRTDHYRH